MRIGPIVITLTPAFRRKAEMEMERPGDYAEDMSEIKPPFPLRPGMHFFPVNHEIRRMFDITPMSSEAIARFEIQPGLSDPEEAQRAMREASGSISIGRPPCKADYRARWRYNSLEFDENGDVRL